VSVTTELCGCKHNGSHWLSMCAPHKAESDGMHEAARKRVSYLPGVTAAGQGMVAWGQGICEVFPDGTIEHVPTEDWLNFEEKL